MEKDEAEAASIAREMKGEGDVTPIHYCRLCEFACPVGE